MAVDGEPEAEKRVLRILLFALALTGGVVVVGVFLGLKDLARYQFVWAFPPIAALVPVTPGLIGIRRAVSGQSAAGIGLPIVAIVMGLICCVLGVFAILAGEMVAKGPIVQ